MTAIGRAVRRLFASRRNTGDGTPTVRRADAHPDAPPRRPLRAADLGGTGFTVPRDLDTPLSAMDPGAIPGVPLEPTRPVVPLASGERLQTFALAQPARVTAVSDNPVPSIDGLMRRLAAG